MYKTLHLLGLLALCLVLAEASLLGDIADKAIRPCRAILKKSRNVVRRVSSGRFGSSRLRGNGYRFVDNNNYRPGDNNTWQARKSDDGELEVRRAVDTPSDEYNAKCFIRRGPSFKKNPILFFYSARGHSKSTLGCQVEVRLDLNTTNSDGDHDPELDFDEPAVRRLLIDSNRYDGSLPTYLLVHGFLSSWDGDNWMCHIKDLVLNNSQANVFILDWSGGAKPMLPLDYSASVSNTKYVAQLVAEFISGLLALSGQPDASNFHLIGHSLGAHISGFIGYSLPRLGRITGLDPAGPCFMADSHIEDRASTTGFLHMGRRRLSPQSASLVLALHTDTALFGLNENCAHYDVYVNGGYKQPKCAANSAPSRFINLLNLNLEESLSPNIACAHSYAHDIIDTFLARTTTTSNTTREPPRGRTSVEPEAKCYPFAYECDDWDAFQAGECAFCLDNDTRCVFTGLSLNNFQPPRLADSSSMANMRAMLGEQRKADLEDAMFNDEDETLGDDSNDSEEALKPSDAYSRGQHFMRSGPTDGPSTCLYHYQVVVATRKSSVAQASDAKRNFYYLHIPLEAVGLLVDNRGERLHDRLIQVSHRLEPQSPAYNYLLSNYQAAVRAATGGPLAPTNDLEFYTALITFKQAPKEQCSGLETDGAKRSASWQLCRPLDGLREARLWSSSELKLGAVQWASLNFMSGANYRQRLQFSYLFRRDPAEGVKSRAELRDSSRANLGELAPKAPRSVGNTAKQLLNQPVSCLLSLLDDPKSTKARTNFKCRRSGRELKFAVKLRPVRLA